MIAEVLKKIEEAKDLVNTKLESGNYSESECLARLDELNYINNIIIEISKEYCDSEEMIKIITEEIIKRLGENKDIKRFRLNYGYYPMYETIVRVEEIEKIIDKVFVVADKLFTNDEERRIIREYLQF